MKAKAVIVSLVCLVIVGVIVARTAQVGAQNQYTTDIAERLRVQGVPVKDVRVISEDPYEIEITLQSSSKDERLAIDDNWYMMLSRREAKLAYRIGKRVDRFKLVLLNTNGEVIDSGQTFLYPENPGQNSSSRKSRVNAQETSEIIKGKLNLGVLSLDYLDVTQETAPGGTGQVVSIQVSAADVTEANKSFPIFMGSLLQTLETINSEYGTYIVLCHLRVVDHQSNILMDYVKDLETRTEQWSSFLGLKHGFSQGPVSAEEPLVPETTPTPFVAYPDP